MWRMTSRTTTMDSNLVNRVCCLGRVKSFYYPPKVTRRTLTPLIAFNVANFEWNVGLKIGQKDLPLNCLAITMGEPALCANVTLMVSRYFHVFGIFNPGLLKSDFFKFQYTFLLWCRAECTYLTVLHQFSIGFHPRLDVRPIGCNLICRFCMKIWQEASGLCANVTL